MKKKNEIELGDTVRDTVSGFEGIALAKMTALYEATQFRVHPTTLDKDGAMRPALWVEVARLEVVPNVQRKVGFVAVEGTKP